MENIQDSRPKAKFNMSISFLNRLNELLNDCNNFSREKDNIAWRDTLRCLYREVSPLMQPKEITDHENQIKEIFEIDITKNPNTRVNGFAINKGEYNNLGVKLDNLEIELRKIIHINDLYLAEKDRTEDAIGDTDD